MKEDTLEKLARLREASQYSRAKRHYNAIHPDIDRDAVYQICLEAVLLEWLTGIKYHVDHIIPLAAGVIAGGVHHQDNLQVITARDNQKKSTKTSPEINRMITERNEHLALMGSICRMWTGYNYDQ